MAAPTPGRAFAAETRITLPTVVFSGESTFETLQKESLLPRERVKMEGVRGSTLDELKWDTLYPVTSYGYPGGAMGVSLGGRSVDDTQVTTLGIPLNLPQGGGADLSTFPSFLWSKASAVSSTSSAGFSQQSVSGNLDLTPWTWEGVNPADVRRPDSRITLSAERDVQSFSIGTRKQGFSVLAGSTFGRQTGPAGSLSYRFLSTPSLIMTANVIGSDQDSENPGPDNAPTPGARKHTVRILPSLMTHWRSDALKIQTTFFGDLQKTDSTDYDTHDELQVFGVESAVVAGDTTIALSARHVSFLNNSAGSFSEWPARGSITEAFHPSKSSVLKATLTTDYLSGYHVFAGARISGELATAQKSKLFTEVQALPKFPSIQDRLYVLPAFGYRGNPDLSPETVYHLIAGYEDNASWIRTRTEVKAEHREDAIVPTADYSTMMNSGAANFLSLAHSARIRIAPPLQVRAQMLATYSRLDSTGRPFPRLPGFSLGGGLAYQPLDAWDLQTQVKWMGESTETDGSTLADYLLLGEKISFSPVENLRLVAGVDNLLDTRVEAIKHYPMPGRIFYASTEIGF